MTKPFARFVCLWISLLFVFPVQLKLQAAPLQSALSDPLDGLDAFVESLLKDWKVTGAAVAIVKDDKLIYSRGFAMRNVKQNLPATPKTLFAIGSTTKAFTAAALGLLVDEGKLEWDKPVRHYLPAFKMHDDYVTEHMTPRDLVTHRSGLPRHDLVWYGSSFQRREMLDRLRYLEPSRGFRATFQYQNLMFMTAGILIEEVAGESWEQFIQKRFFDPLEMKTSNFSVTVSQKTSDFAMPYVEKKGEVQEVPFRNIDEIGPAGSINSCVDEMANWLIMQINKGKFKNRQIVSENSLKETHTPQIISGSVSRHDELLYPSYAMGWGVNGYRGHLMLSHGGGIDGFTALVSLLPKDKIGIVVLTNRGGTPLPSIVAYNAYDRLLGLSQVPWNQRSKEDAAKAKEAEEKSRKEADAARKAGTKPSHSLQDYAGRFEHPGYGVVTIETESEQLKAKYNSFTSPLKHYHYDVFEASDEILERQKFTFETNLKGDIDRLRVPLQSGVSDIVFTRMPEAKPLDKAVLSKFAGQYELSGIIITVSIRGENTLMLDVPGQPVYEMVYMKGTEFNFKGLKGYSLEFKKDASDAVESVIITQPNGTFTAKRRH